MAEERESWGNHCEFFLTSLGLAVGLGNVWRFPYVAYENGGGTFLIPYILMLFVVGLPGFWIELSIGQYGRVGANKVFGRMVPIFKGLGYGMLTVRFFVNIYYVVIEAWSLFYLFAGMTKNLPWEDCTNKWNTYDCYTLQLEQACNTNLNNDTGMAMPGPFTFYNKTCTLKSDYCKEHGYDDYLYYYNKDYCVESNDDGSVSNYDLKILLQDNGISPAEDYFNGHVLGVYKSPPSADLHTWDNFGKLQWELVLCLLLAWALVCLVMIKGLQSYGKAAYVITLSPYVVLTALLIYAVQLEGASDGIEYFIKPDWSKLGNYDIWSAAASQILFSLSVGYGSQLILSSFNNFHNNTHRDAILVAIFNSLTSIYAGFVVFAILGYLMYLTQSPMEKVVQSGITLAFVSYPSAVIEMDVPPLWSFLFFFMLINLAMSSICGGLQTFISFVLDEHPKLNKYRIYVVICSCSVFFLLGLPFTAAGGIHLFTLFDDRCTKSLLLLTFMEIIVVSWFYGVNRFLDNIREMSMKLPSWLEWCWRALLVVIAPVVLIVVSVLSWIGRDPLSYSGYVYPDSVQSMAWVLEFIPLMVVAFYPIYTVYVYHKKKGYEGKELLQKLLAPTESWYETERPIGEGKVNEGVELDLSSDDESDKSSVQNEKF